MASVGSDNQRLSQLQAWLDAGWVIEEPVLQRSVYHGLNGRVCAFEVVVRHRERRQVIALHDAPDVQLFLLQRRLAVLDLA